VNVHLKKLKNTKKISITIASVPVTLNRAYPDSISGRLNDISPNSLADLFVITSCVTIYTNVFPSSENCSGLHITVEVN
jgi:hypothetical protein